MTRVLVVGAGSNGLMAAVHLAAAGLDVTVLEHAPAPGGASSSHTGTLPGFVHDSCAGFNPMTAVSPAFQELALERDGVEWVHPPTPIAHPFDGGAAIALERDVEATAASIDAIAPGAGDGWRELMGLTLTHAERIAHTILRPFPPVGPPLRLALALRRDGVTLARRLLGSAEAFGLDVFDGAERPTAWFAASAQHSGLPPTAEGGGAFGFLLNLIGHSHGWPFPRGGQGELASALVRRAEREGARVRCDAHVEQVLVRRSRVAGVRLAGGEEIGADAVVTTVSAHVLAAMLPDDALPGRLLTRLRKWRYGTAAFKIDYALSAPVPWEAEAARRAAVVHVAGELDELTKAAQESQRGALPEHPALVVGQHSLFDDTRAPAGQHTLYTYAHVPSHRGPRDEAVVERMEAQLERFAPGFGDTILDKRVRGPALTEEENPSLVGGDIGGGAYELDQQVVFRPAPELVRYRAPLRGLYVAGASVHPAGAVHGMSGRGAARALLADRRLRPWRSPG